ncbi:alpha/beta hydrolase domain-containing protein [Mycena floridula]|nr:alpha/beta hydrolase domain-containing protein [Mycena floridula]
MEKIAELNAKEQEIPKVRGPTIDILSPLLQARSGEILATPKRTYQYGETSRHQLDIYYPSKTAGDKTPVLFFIYGGGWVNGDRKLAALDDLAYANVGYYFSQHGFITIIPDYRLVPTVTFPAPAQDIRDAVQWVVDHPVELVFGGVSSPDIDSLFLVSHSAGANLATTVLALPELYSDKLHPRIKRIVLVSGAYRYIAEAPGASASSSLFVMHWGSLEESLKKDSVALMSQVPVERVPPIFCIQAESDPDAMKVNEEALLDTLAARPGIKFTRALAKGHNHLSLVWALGTGEGEEWAEQAVHFMKESL